MANKFRATMHNGRIRVSGESYSVKHNDRDFDTSHAEHINQASERKNRYFIVNTDGSINTRPTITFEQHEKNVYAELFGASLARQTERHIKAGHANRVRSMDDYRTAARTCPEETILQLGTREDYADPQAFINAVNSWCRQMQAAYGTNWRLLDGALHFDESTPHCHIRAVWTAEGADGLEVSQNKALKELGISRPDVSKPQDRHNNPKQIFTQVSRQIWIDSARKFGIEIEDIPETPGKATLTKEEYLKEKIRRETAELRAECVNLNETSQALHEEISRQKGIIAVLRDLLRPLNGLVDRLARLICIDGRSALEHCRDHIAAMQNPDTLDDIDI